MNGEHKSFFDTGGGGYGDLIRQQWRLAGRFWLCVAIALFIAAIGRVYRYHPNWRGGQRYSRLENAGADPSTARGARTVVDSRERFCGGSGSPGARLGVPGNCERGLKIVAVDRQR